eukprot:150600_1
MIHSQFDRILWISITYMLILSLKIFMILIQYFESNMLFVLRLYSNWSSKILQNDIQCPNMYMQAANNICSIYKYTKTIINSISYVTKKLHFKKKMMKKNEKYKILCKLYLLLTFLNKSLTTSTIEQDDDKIDDYGDQIDEKHSFGHYPMVLLPSDLIIWRYIPSNPFIILGYYFKSNRTFAFRFHSNLCMTTTLKMDVFSVRVCFFLCSIEALQTKIKTTTTVGTQVLLFIFSALKGHIFV